MSATATEARAVTKTRATVDYLRRCQAARAAGYPVSFTTDPAWLVNQLPHRFEVAA